MTKSDDGRPEARAERAPRRIFGRRRGPALSAHQERLLETVLPALTYEPLAGRDPKRAFSVPIRDVWLEVGFGAGEHLLWQAAHHPDIGLIGAEPYISGVAKLLSKLAGGTLSLGRDAGGEEAPANLRLFTDDARIVLDALPDGSLGRVFILFPDPWPKTRHHKRRFVQTDALDILARVMRPGAELRFASDDADYLNWTLERLMAHPAFQWTARCAQDWKARPGDWPPTRYESKALHGPPAFLRFVRR
jgi:tRNA (guanine-N7-)-methyltransferase